MTMFHEFIQITETKKSMNHPALSPTVSKLDTAFSQSCRPNSTLASPKVYDDAGVNCFDALNLAIILIKLNSHVI